MQVDKQQRRSNSGELMVQSQQQPNSKTASTQSRSNNNCPSDLFQESHQDPALVIINEDYFHQKEETKNELAFSDRPDFKARNTMQTKQTPMILLAEEEEFKIEIHPQVNKQLESLSQIPRLNPKNKLFSSQNKDGDLWTLMDENGKL